MLRSPRTVRPWRIIARRPYSATVRPPPNSKSTTPVAVDDDCIPLSATYSLADYLPSKQPSLSRETILKLHRLAALQPPETDKDWHQLQDLDQLVAIVQAVRDVDTSILGLDEGAMVDARVRAEPEPIDWSPSSSSSASTADATQSIDGQELLKLAQRIEGAYYVAPMPENVRTRKRSSTGAAAAAAEDAESHLSPDEL